MAAARTFRRALEVLLGAVCVALMVGLSVLVVVAAIVRKAGHSFTWYDEVAAVMLAWLTYYGAALAALRRAHLGFPGLMAGAPPALRVPLVLLAEALVIGFFAVLAWVGVEVLIILEGDTLTSLPWVPVRFTQSVIPIGALLFIVAELCALPEALREARGGAGAEVKPSSGASVTTGEP